MLTTRLQVITQPGFNNSDDTVKSVMDPRGASQGIHLQQSPLGQNHFLFSPCGNQFDCAVNYEYDAVGNRTFMTDAVGSMSYEYDQLSGVSSETRTISGLGTYPLSYSYNLAGAIKSVTDPFGAQINYNFDVAGRVASVTGSGFGGVSNYTSSTSNIQYRAWGGQKSVTYGDGKSGTYDV